MGNCLNLCESKLTDLSPNEALYNATHITEKFSLNGKNMWGKVVYCYDGDTVHIVFDYKNTMTKFICRLNGIDTPEIATKDLKEKEAGIKSRNYLFNLITDQKIDGDITKKEITELCSKSKKLIWVKCMEFDKYGRLLVDLYQDHNDSKSINMHMIENKYAVPYDGGTKKSFTEDNFA